MAGFTVRSRGISEGRGATPAVPNGNPLNADKVFYAALPPYNVKTDVRTLTNAALSAAGVVSSPTYTFAQADVGKLAVYIYGASTTAHLYTTIASVSAGQAQLAASGVAVASGEFVFGTDNTTKIVQAVSDAGAVGGVVELPDATEGIGINAALSSSNPITIRGQGARELFGGTTSLNDADFPTIAPYLQGSVLVQFAPATDILQLSAQGRTQDARGIGLRFAGRYQNAGHGLNSTSAGGYLGNIGGVFEGVKVFGHDGNHYGFIVDSPELMRVTSCRSYGGGGMWQKTNATTPGPPGPYTQEDFYSITMIGGSAHGMLLDASAGQYYDYCTFVCHCSVVSAPSPAIPGTAAPTSAQKCLQTLYEPGGHLMLNIGWDDPIFESNVGSTALFPVGPGCYRTNDSVAAVANAKPTTSPASGAAFQNLMGVAKVGYFACLLAPAAAATASTTLSAQANAGANSITVTSTTGFAAGQGIQIDTGNKTEFAVISSVAGSTINLVEAAGFGLSMTHLSGVTVAAGAAVVIAQNSNTGTFPGTQKLAWSGAAIGAAASQQTIALPIPSAWYGRLDYANVAIMWGDYASPLG